MSPFAWILLSAVLFVGADIAIRQWLETHWYGGFTVAMLVYMIGIFCLVMSFFGSNNIAVATLISIVFNIVGYMAVAYLLYGDTVSQRELAGVALGLIAVAILEIG